MEENLSKKCPRRPPGTSHCSELGYLPVLEPANDKGEGDNQNWRSLIMMLSWDGHSLNTFPELEFCRPGKGRLAVR